MVLTAIYLQVNVLMFETKLRQTWVLKTSLLGTNTNIYRGENKVK